MSVGSTRAHVRFALAVVLASGFTMAHTQGDADASNAPAPPPGPYTSMTLVDIPVEEAEGLNFPPLDYDQSLEASQVPPAQDAGAGSELPGTLPAEPGVDLSSYPPLEDEVLPDLEESVAPAQAPEPLAQPPAEEPMGAEPRRTPSAVVTPPAIPADRSGPAARPSAPYTPTSPEASDSASVYVPLEPSEEPGTRPPGGLVPESAATETAEPTPQAYTGSAAQAPRGAPGAPEAPVRPAPPSTGQRPSPGYGYRGWQAPQPYYPVPPAWGQVPGRVGTPGQAGQGMSGHTPQGRAAPAYPGMYYPPGGYGRYHAPGPAQGPEPGGPR
jgi:hypothetical protein